MKAWKLILLEDEEETGRGKWRFEVASECNLRKASDGIVPKNTEKNDRWALNVFRSWMDERNRRCETLLCSVTVWLYDSVLAACLKICVIGVTVFVCILYIHFLVVCSSGLSLIFGCVVGNSIRILTRLPRASAQL